MYFQKNSFTLKDKHATPNKKTQTKQKRVKQTKQKPSKQTNKQTKSPNQNSNVVTFKKPLKNIF